jgi:hypothetical protein
MMMMKQKGKIINIFLNIFIYSWSNEDKYNVFKYLTNNGIPINNEGKSNFMELKEKILMKI